VELSQLHEDIIHYENDSTDAIIANFERNNSSSDGNDGFGSSPVFVFNCDWWEEPPDSSDELSNACEESACVTQDNAFPLKDPDLFEQLERDYNLDKDTDSEDHDDNAANVAELLHANMKLLTFLTQQSETIARLRTRIVQLKTLIYDLSFRPVGELPDNANTIPSPTTAFAGVYYGVQRGRLIGVCDSLAELHRCIDGCPNSVFQSFPTWQAGRQRTCH
jgi:hypothetical protein